MNLTHRIEEATMQYGSGTRKCIGDFIIKERHNIHKYSIQEIADKTFTSKATLVRFAKSLGFSGWREFINAFVEEQRYQDKHYSSIDPNYPFKASSTQKDIINQMCSLQMESLMDTADLILSEIPMLNGAEALIRRSNRISLFGLSPNNYLGELFARRMLSIGKVIDTSFQYNFGLLASSLTERDCAIIVSYSGNNELFEPMTVIPILRQNHVPLIGITSIGDNLLRENADYTLSISSQERLYSKISTFATETSILYILNVLFSCYFVQDYDNNLQRKIDTGRRLEKNQRFTAFGKIQELDDDMD